MSSESGNWLSVVNAKCHPRGVDQELYADPLRLAEAREQFILAEQFFGGQRVAVVDKSSPHSLTDAMVVADSADEQVLSFNMMNEESRGQLLRHIHQFNAYVHQEGTIVRFSLGNAVCRVSANVAKMTEDRFSVQGDRTLHTHLICYRHNGDVAERVDLNDPENRRIRQAVLDPLAATGSVILKSLLFDRPADVPGTLNFPGLQQVSAEMSLNGVQLPPALYLEFSSWNALLDPAFSKFMAELETRMEQAYYRILDLLCTGEVSEMLGRWQRRTLLPEDLRELKIRETGIIPEELKRLLIGLTGGLRNIPAPVMERLQKGRAGNKSTGMPESLLSYAGPTYTYTFFSPGTVGENSGRIADVPMYLAVTPLLTRTSGAGGLLFDENGGLIKINKNCSGVMTQQELQLRREFQQGLVSVIAER